MHLPIYWLGIVTALLAVPLQAEKSNSSVRFGAYEIAYNFFPSTLLVPEIAAIHGIKRSKYEVLLNVAVHKDGQSGAVPAGIKGFVRNMLQQQKKLEFKAIEESDTVYYIAPIRVTKKEILHFDIDVQAENLGEWHNLKLTKTLYAD